MARLSHTLLATTLLLLAIAARAQPDEEPQVCADSDAVYEVEDGAVVAGPGDVEEAMLIAEQLAAAVAAEVHKDEECVVTYWRTKKFCATPILAGETLATDDTVATVNGTLYDMEVVERISCPDGHFKVRYQARGIKPTVAPVVPEGTEEDAAATDDLLLADTIQTRFIDVFDSSYLDN